MPRTAPPPSPRAAAESPRRRARLHDWFAEVVEHLGAPSTHLLAIGTVLHRDSLLARLLARPDFESLRCRSIIAFPPPSPEWAEWRRLLLSPDSPTARADARAFFRARAGTMARGTEVLWPEHEDIEALMAQLAVGGRRAFHQEKQNEPLGPDDALFDLQAIWTARRVAGGWQRIAPGNGGERGTVLLDGALRRFGHLDAALGRSGARGDFAALATVLLAPCGAMVLAGCWTARAAPSRQVEALLDAHARAPFERIGVEATGFQELLAGPIAEEAARRGLAPPPIRLVRPRAAKASRIAALEPLLAAGRLALAEDLPEEFWTQLGDFPRARHDDALDAAAGAADLAVEASRAGSEGARRVARREARADPGAY